MAKVILKQSSNKDDGKISRLILGELAIITGTSNCGLAFKDDNNDIVYITPDKTPIATWIEDEEKGMSNKNGFSFNKTDIYHVIGNLIYSTSANAAGGTLTPINTLGITKNGVNISNFTITYSSSQSYASVSNDGKVTFAASTNTSARTTTITATILCEGKSFTKTAIASQNAYVPDAIELTGNFSYGSGNVNSTGGTASIASNTLQLVKNGIPQSVSFTYSLNNSTYASINTSTGSVTFQNNTGGSRSVTVTAKCTYDSKTYTKTASITQAAYVPPVETLTYYTDIKTTSIGIPVSISDITSPSSYTNGTFSYTIPVKGNTIILLCPSSKSLQSCVKQGEILDDITTELNSSVTNVTYNGKEYKMYQFKYSANIINNTFEIKFN